MRNKVLAIIENNKKILVGSVIDKAKKEFGGLQYVFPGGKVEENETLEEAVIREVYEETKLNVAVIEKIGSRIHPVTGMQLHYFFCKSEESEADHRDPLNEDIDNLEWVELEELFNRMPDIYPKAKKYLIDNLS